MDAANRGDHVMVADKGFNAAVGIVVKRWGDDTVSVVWPSGKGNGGFWSPQGLRKPTPGELKTLPVATLPIPRW